MNAIGLITGGYIVPRAGGVGTLVCDISISVEETTEMVELVECSEAVTVEESSAILVIEDDPESNNLDSDTVEIAEEETTIVIEIPPHLD